MNTMATYDSDMNSEFKRYATFSGFQTPAGVWPSQLAQGGFYRSVNSGCQVVCFSCGLKVDVKKFLGESVMNVHRRLSPSCGLFSGSAENEPVPEVDTQGYPGLDWISQNFNFSGGFHSLPSDMMMDGNVEEDGATEESSQSYSLPPLNFSASDLAPVLPLFSDLNTLEQSSTNFNHQSTNLDSLPSDLVDGFSNATLQSVSPQQMFHGGNPDPASRPFASVLGLADSVPINDAVPDEGLVPDDVEEDGASAGVEGEYPLPDIPDTPIPFFAPLPINNNHPSEFIISEMQPRQKITFDDLGIVVQRPKRHDMVHLAKRLQTFDRWQGDHISQTKESIAEAGFYYAGYADCCRCFYCGGGLKSWEHDDDPWIEHARWFKECPYLKTSKGVNFIAAVQSLARTNNIIQMPDVEQELKRQGRPSSLMSQHSVSSCDEMPECDDITDTNTAMSELESENDILRRPEMCKICLDDEVCVLFVPCGHLVTCYTCSPSVLACPVCRQQIQGRVRIERGD